MSAPDTVTLEDAIQLAQSGQLEAAQSALRALLDRDPSFARAWNALGVVQMQQGRLEEANSSLLRAVQASPRDFRAHLNLGKLCHALGRSADAVSYLRAAVQLAPDSADAHFSLAALLNDGERLPEAEHHLRRAIELSPRDADAHYLLARLLRLTGRFEQAEFCLREVLRLKPDFAIARSDLAMLLLETGRVREAQENIREAVRIAPGLLQARSSYVWCSQYDLDASDAELMARAREAGSAIQAAANRFARPIRGTAGTQSGLRLGMVSGDLHQHPVGLLLLPLLRELKRLNVKTMLYSNGTKVDVVSQQLRQLAQWSDITRDPDEQAWERICRDAPDVLVDLAGHTGNNRLAIFAARAAPLQLSWLGYFATTGTPNMDCVLMDPWHAPEGSEAQFTERLLRMPHTRFCFQPIDDAPAVPQRAASAARITFGSFNNVAKINEKVVRAWSRILLGTPGSRLILKWRTLAVPVCLSQLVGWFQRAGVDHGRLEFRPESRYDEMLGEYGDIDIALDTFPFTGGQTSFEALWMGVPVVTLAGSRPVTRQTLCALGNLGLEDLASDSVDGFVDLAIALAKDPARLGELRATLRKRIRASPLMDASGFAQSFVDLLRDAAGAVV